LLIITFAFALPAMAAEIWVAPHHKNADKKIGDWAVTEKGNARFSFSVPDNLNNFVGANLVVIGKKTTTITYDLLLSVSKDSMAHDDTTTSMTDQQADIEKDMLSEIDVSAVFPADLVPGSECMSLHFNTIKKQYAVSVVGLRFIYDANVETLGGLSPDDYWKKAEDVFTGDVTGTGDNLQLAPGVVGTAELATGAVSESRLGFDTATQAELDAEASLRTGGDTHSGDVSGPNSNLQIQPNRVGSQEVADSSITRNDILDEPGVDFYNNRGFTGIGDRHELSTTWQDMDVIHITHPASGYVTCIATGAMDWQNNKERQALLGWSTQAGDFWPQVLNLVQPEASSDDGPEIPISTMYTFTVSGAGTTTFRLKARLWEGDDGDVWYWDQAAACMYFPTKR
jgi:hypothetical protein